MLQGIFLLFFKLFVAVNLKTTDDGKNKIHFPCRGFDKSQEEDSHFGTHVTQLKRVGLKYQYKNISERRALVVNGKIENGFRMSLQPRVLSEQKCTYLDA